MSQTKQHEWTTVAQKSDLVSGAGVGALYNGKQVALFLVPDLDDELFALSNYCPFSGVHIIARGIVGDIQGEPVVATPLYKQHFSLRTGQCIEDQDVRLERFLVRLNGNEVQVASLGAEELAA